ncbi:DUF4179 domain-containing protein [Virgibacillus sp. DJP39]|uniref:DUF4179 domain-containing protein n=1 Tax=Virgibacillus sp. DJP39 TaxID=3409790 RepID=UPI003BB784BC
MDKEHFEKEMNKIEVPKHELFNAIDQGIEKGKRKKNKKKSKRKLTAIVSSSAAATFLASGLVFAPITNVFASVPVIGSIYEKLSLQIGKELLASDLITDINQEATSNGVKVKVTSAYYDGNVIGITFEASGEDVSYDELKGERGPEAGYSYHLFDGVEQKQWSASMTGLTKTANGYAGAIELFNPNAKLPKDYTLPLTFSYMAGAKGNWKFDVPVERIPFDSINAEGDDVSIHGDYALKMKSVVKGKATTMLEYDVELPEVGKEDNVRLTVYDNFGNELSKRGANMLDSELENGIIHKQFRELFPSKIDKDASHLIVKPEIERYERDTIHTLDQSTPFVVKSNRFDYQITVNNVEKRSNRLLVDYSVQNVNTDTIRQDIIQNFADFIHIIDSDDIKYSNGQLDMNNMLESMVRSEQTKLIDKKTLHFQSNFVMKDIDEISYKDFSLMVPFGTLSLNDKDIKMDPIKVDLK